MGLLVTGAATLAFVIGISTGPVGVARAYAIAKHNHCLPGAAHGASGLRFEHWKNGIGKRASASLCADYGWCCRSLKWNDGSGHRSPRPSGIENNRWRIHLCHLLAANCASNVFRDHRASVQIETHASRSRDRRTQDRGERKPTWSRCYTRPLTVPGIEHHVVSLFGDGELSGERLLNLGIQQHALDLRPYFRERRFLAAAREVQTLLETLRPDLVQAHLTWQPVHRVVCRLAGRSPTSDRL